MELTERLKAMEIFFTPSIEIRIDNLERIPLIELMPNNEESIYNQVRKSIKSVLNYTWDNSILRVSNIFGDEFAIYINLGKFKDVPTGWEITIWNYKGNSTIGSWKKKYIGVDDKLTREEIRDMKKRLEEYSYNIQHCSDCGATMPSDKTICKTEKHEKEFGGQYFAGHYCKDCWERKWKAIEAKETYE
jgi:hypothetical protein